MVENKRFRIYQDVYEDFYIEDIKYYNNQKFQQSYKIGNEEDVKYKDIENIVDLLNDQEKRINDLKETIINNACYSYEKKIKELEQENKMLKTTISRNEAYIKRVTTKGKWSNTSDIK